MKEAFIRWWNARAPRERTLLLTMLVLAALVFAWLLVIRPLGDGLAYARERHGTAVTALAELRARADAGTGVAARPALSAPLDILVGRSAADAGFPVSMRPAGRGRLSLSLEAARPQAFFAWVQQLEAQGVTVERLAATPNSDRTLTVEITLRAGRG